MYLTTDRHLAHAFAEQLLLELRHARSSAKALARYTGSIDAAKAETRLALAIEDLTDLSAQLAPAKSAKEPAESAETAALRTAAESGDRKAQRTAEQDAAQFANLAWRAIGRAGKPRGIAKPVMRTAPRHTDIHLHPKPFGAHPALPPRNARPI